MKLGRYTVIGRLATGGMAEVLLARQEGPGGFDRLVALKRILPHLASSRDIVALFEGEARTAVRLHHPNIVQVHDFALEDSGYVLALEYVPGADLRALAGKRLPPGLVAWIGSEIAGALAHAHAQGIVHGDVSPSNVLVGRDGTVKLGDFGVAGQAGRPACLGKRGYAAPEMRRGGELDRRADLYGLGVVLAELATGRRFSPAALPDGLLGEALAIAVATERADRYESAEAMGAALESLGLPTSEARRALAAEIAALRPLEAEAGASGDENTVRMWAPTVPVRQGLGRRFFLIAGAAVIAAAAALGAEPSQSAFLPDFSQWAGITAGGFARAEPLCSCPDPTVSLK